MLFFETKFDVHTFLLETLKLELLLFLMTLSFGNERPYVFFGVGVGGGFYEKFRM
jgi:hypothetical protein